MKKITVLFTVLLMLAASSAFAVTPAFPPALNGTYTVGTVPGSYTFVSHTPIFLTGFTANASRSASTVESSNQTFIYVNSSKVVMMSQASAGSTGSKGNSTLTGRLGFFNQTDVAAAGYVSFLANGTAGANKITLGNATSFSINQAYANIRGLTYLSGVNASNAPAADKAGNPINPIRMVSTGGSALLVGLGNQTEIPSFATGGTTAGQRSGSVFMMGYENGTFLAPVYSTSATWDLYAAGYSYDIQEGYYVIGQVQMLSAYTSGYNAQAKFVVYGADNQVLLNRSDRWYRYNATASTVDYGRFSLIGSGSSFPLMEGATLNKDRNMATGSIYADTTQPTRHFAVMIKNGQALSTADIQNRSFKMVYAGYGASKLADNATDGLMALALDDNLQVTGNGVFHFGDGVTTSFDEKQVSLNDYKVALSTTNQFKSITQSNMTITQADGKTLSGNMYGKQTANKDYAVGIYQPARAGARNGFALCVMVPDTAVVGNPQTASSTFQNNATLESVVGYSFRLNSTSTNPATKSEMQDIWTSLPSTFTPITGVIGFNATNRGMGKQKGNVYVTFQIPFSGVGYKVSSLALYKVFPTTAKTVRAFTYASRADATEKASDGIWWISTLAGDGYLGANSVLAPTSDYYINYVLKDNGNYEYRSQDREFGDPVILGTIISSSSSSSGCVFNPAASFGLEWLLLMLAPMVAIVRSRFKK